MTGHNESLSTAMRQAMRTMGCELFSADHFVHCAVLWLLERGPIMLGIIDEDGLQEQAFYVNGCGERKWACADESLLWALVAAIRTVEYIEDSPAEPEAEGAGE